MPIIRLLTPAVFLLLLLCGCRDQTGDDFNRAWAAYHQRSKLLICLSIPCGLHHPTHGVFMNAITNALTTVEDFAETVGVDVETLVDADHDAFLAAARMRLAW